ncbi:MAG: formate dehydrogenase subunit alpha [Deltaproteobacteria bacterium]|nr:formate dehydrogenase subunit alpha [Deltaproteobacteria bacterium]
MIRDVETICPFCGAGCRLVLRAREEDLVSVYPASHGVNEGKLCIKGWSAHEFVHHPARLTHPLVRECRGDDFRETSWDEALDVIAERLKDTLGNGGSDAAAFIGSAKCTNEDNYALQKFARAVAGSPHIDHCARLCHASTVAGLMESFGSGAMTGSIEELEDADVIFVIGSNTTEQHPLVGRRILRAVREKDSALIVADPRRIDLTGFARIHLRHRPGTDTALINGLLHVIIAEGMEDRAFIEERTEGFEELARSLGDYAPRHVAAVTGVPADAVIEAARLFGKAKRAAIVYAMGITQHVAGTDNVLALANLVMATGNVGKRSAGLNPLRGQNNVQGACDMGVLPDVYPGYRSIGDDGAHRFFSGAWGTDRLPRSTGRTLREIIDAALEGTVSFMYLMGENPALSDPDITHTRRALEAVRFLVVHDIFPTETTAFAHVILPAASYAEKDGTFTSTERRVQRIRKAIEPPGLARPEWQVLGALARCMNYGGMNWEGPDEIFREIAQVTQPYRGMSYDRLGDEGLQWPCPAKDHPGTPFLHQESFPRGRGRFVPVRYEPPPELPDEEYPFMLMTGRSLFQYHTGTMTRKSPTLQAQLDEAFLEMNPDDAARLDVADGGRVAVTSRRGRITVRTRVTERVSQGMVFIPIHFAEAAANTLTLRAFDPRAHIPELKLCAVKVEIER